MIRRPPRSTRTDTLFPYTTLFRSGCGGGVERYRRCLDQVQAIRYHGDIRSRDEEMLGMGSVVAIETVDEPGDTGAAWQFNAGAGGLNSAGEVPAEPGVIRLVYQCELMEEASCHYQVDRVDRRGTDLRSEERRVGKEGVSTFISGS